MDIGKLTPEPWQVVASRDVLSAVISPGNATVATDFTTDADAEFVCLARSALDVMRRRQWVATYFRDFGKWWVTNGQLHSLYDSLTPEKWPCLFHDDPFTALVETDKWYTANDPFAERPKQPTADDTLVALAIMMTRGWGVHKEGDLWYVNGPGSYRTSRLGGCTDPVAAIIEANRFLPAKEDA